MCMKKSRGVNFRWLSAFYGKPEMTNKRVFHEITGIIRPISHRISKPAKISHVREASPIEKLTPCA